MGVIFYNNFNNRLEEQNHESSLEFFAYMCWYYCCLCSLYIVAVSLSFDGDHIESRKKN